MKQYDLVPNKSIPSIMVKLPSKTLRNLVLRAEENGYDIHLEISRRLTHSLERDLEMIEEDNSLAYTAFQRVHEDDTPL